MKNWRSLVLMSGLGSALGVAAVLIVLQVSLVPAITLTILAPCVAMIGTVLAWLTRRTELEDRGFHW